MNKLFVVNTSVNDYQNELLVAFEKLSDKIDVQKISIAELNINFLNQNNISLVIADELPLEWIYLLKGMKITNLVFGNVQKYHHNADIVIDYKSTDVAKYFCGQSFSVVGNPDFDFEEVTDLIYIMKWDSDFFEFPVAFISSKYLSDTIHNYIDFFTHRNKIRLVEYLCNCHDDISVKVAEKNNFHFTDIRITFDINLAQHYEINNGTNFVFGLANNSHLFELKELTKDMYKDSRYFFDGNFPIEKINDFYSQWIEKAVLGIFDHECYCLYDASKPIAFCTIRYTKAHAVHIGLFGVHKEYSGQGLGKILLHNVFNKLATNNIKKMFVVTQGRNYPAQRLYQSVGFKTFSTELWYHKWMN